MCQFANVQMIELLVFKNRLLNTEYLLSSIEIISKIHTIILTTKYSRLSTVNFRPFSYQYVANDDQLCDLLLHISTFAYLHINQLYLTSKRADFFIHNFAIANSSSFVPSIT